MPNQNVLCTVDGCERKPYKRGYCNPHYIRQRRHGSPTGGPRPMHGEPERYFKTVVLMFDLDECLIWPYGMSGDYPSVYIEGKQLFAHVLACEAKHGPKPSPFHYAAHSCNVRMCCSKQHLRWATPTENSLDRIAHGTMNNKLNIEQVREIRKLRGTIGQRAIAERFCVTKNAIKSIFDGKTWAWLD